MIIAVGSTNPAKVKAAKIAARKLFPKAKVIGVSVVSDVSDQPMSDEESIKGAINRAKGAITGIHGAKYGVGMEGGAQLIGKKYFECGWIAVVDKNGKVGLGSSARFELSAKIAKRLGKGFELNDAMRELTGVDKHGNKEGMMGVITNGKLPRATAYSHGILFAFAPFVSNKKFWD